MPPKEVEKDYVKPENCPDYLSRMYDEYDEVCNEINNGFIAETAKRHERLTALINKLMDDDSEESKKFTAMQKSYFILQHQAMSTLLSSIRGYERSLALRIDYENYMLDNDGE
jgi:hypothetical protein